MSSDLEEPDKINKLLVIKKRTRIHFHFLYKFILNIYKII